MPVLMTRLFSWLSALGQHPQAAIDFTGFLKGLPELMANENKTTEGKQILKRQKFKAGFMTHKTKEKSLEGSS
ncbi:hypothetical protein ACEQPO_14115 [Bacillus sp. SL00103]